MSTQVLIEAITPSYNAYQKGQGTLTPTELIMLMWDIGAAIERHVNEHKIPPHALYRQVYGKSEGTQNIKQRSYIAREFLSRSYRVKRIFKTKSEIKKQLPKLSAINHFREAMPFFDNPKYVLGAKEKQELLRVINGPLSNKEKENYIQKLQSKKIGIKNPRTQNLNLLDEDKLVFVKLYNDVFNALKLENYDKAKKALSLPSPKFLAILSLNCGAISADGLMMEKFEPPKDLSAKWKAFVGVIQKLIKDENPKERRRFRRLIPPERMIRLSEMLYALTTPEKYKSFKI